MMSKQRMKEINEMKRAYTATITMTDNHGVVSPATWLIGRQARDVAYAIMSYARQNSIAPSRVGYSVIYQDLPRQR